MIFEYMMNIDSSSRKRHPGWVEHGGAFYDGSTFIGWSPNAGARDYYVPDSVTVLDKAGLVERNLAVHAVTPFTEIGDDPSADSEELTTAEVTAKAEAWYDETVLRDA